MISQSTRSLTLYQSSPELQDATKATQNNKATGLDGIPAEVWKMDCLRDQLLKVCNKAYHGDVPAIWRKGAILPFPKKGDLGKTANYRGITLSLDWSLQRSTTECC